MTIRLPRTAPTVITFNELESHPRAATAATSATSVPLRDRQLLLQDRLSDILASCIPGSQFNDSVTGDVRLTLTSIDSLTISITVHRHILASHSRFFAAIFSDRWSEQQRSLPHLLEIFDCEDVEIYVETLRLMYCKDLRRRLMKEDVTKVLGILKVSAEIVFDAGVLSCLEYLEAAPWVEDGEEKVVSLLSQLHLESSGAGEVLKRVSLEAPPAEEAGASEDKFVHLLQMVLEGRDVEARRESRTLVFRMLRVTNASTAPSTGSGVLSRESLYSACDGCLRHLRHFFLRAAESDLADTGQIARQADNRHWILDD